MGDVTFLSLIFTTIAKRLKLATVCICHPEGRAKCVIWSPQCYYSIPMAARHSGAICFGIYDSPINPLFWVFARMWYLLEIHIHKYKVDYIKKETLK